MVYLQVENVTRRYGELLLFERISFSIHKGEKVALIAKNGAGKTSLFNIIVGKDAPEEGEVIFRNNIRVGYLDQLPGLNSRNTVMQEVFASSDEMLKGIMQYEEAMESGDPGAYQQAIEEMDRLKAWDYEVKIKQILTRLKIDDLHQQVSVLSGGQKKRLALAKALIHEPDLLILDEPTNHLDLDMIEWLEEYLENTSLTLLMVTHDRYFLDNVCTHMIELDDQQIYTYKGNYSFYLEKREERLAAKQSGTDKAQNLLRKELEWIRRMPKARGHKAKYRVNAFQDLKEKASGQTTGKKMQMNVQVRRIGKKILEIKDLSKAYGDNVLLKDFSYTFSSQEKIGIIGKNGTGKTTFLHMITENILPDSGVLSKGETVTFGYYKQEGMSFREDQKVIEAVQDIAEVVTLSDGSTISASQFLSMFLFPPPMQYVYISKLSGGEKRRLYLLTVLMKNPNFLILDEPTNDLDILILNVLEEYLENFPGCVLIVSHDRYFMDKLVDHLFVFEGNGKVKDFPGNYTRYRSSVKPEEPQKADKPKEKKSTNKSIPSAPKERKLTYNEKKELEQLEEEITTLEMEKTSLEEELASGDLSNELLTEKSLRIGVVLKQLEEKELRWLELSEYAL